LKLASFTYQGRAAYGVAQPDHYLVPPAEFLSRFPDLASVLRAGALAELEAAVRNSGTQVQPEAVQALPVVPAPGKIFCVGLNYKTHVAEMKRADADYPAIFVRFADSLIAAGDTLLRPSFSERFDYEGELAIVIGKGGRHIAQADAFDHIAGYACFNDGSVRDWQRHTHQWTPGKNFPGTGAFTSSAGELRSEISPSGVRILGDVDGNGVADFAIFVLTTQSLAATDFVL
jgi:2-keto-4-pentenoate hydratase/2-oxohepta-3-ene-1,7-dioic acid hydratase in catechol pathway